MVEYYWDSSDFPVTTLQLALSLPSKYRPNNLHKNIGLI